MRSGISFGSNLSSLVEDRHRAVAGVFHDLALGDVDERRTVAMAVPRNDAARLDGELAETKLAILELRRLLRQIDGAQRRVGDALGGEHDRLARVFFGLVGRALAGERR